MIFYAFTAQTLFLTRIRTITELEVIFFLAFHKKINDFN